MEKLTGINFFADLPEEHQKQLEKSMDLDLWFNQEEEKTISDAEPLPSKKGQYNTAEAKSQIGKKCKICGMVVSVKYIATSKGTPTNINLDKKFPNHVFSVTIWGKERKNFRYIPEQELPGKIICVKGKVEQYKDIPQIIVTNEKQIEFVEEEK